MEFYLTWGKRCGKLSKDTDAKGLWHFCGLEEYIEHPIKTIFDQYAKMAVNKAYPERANGISSRPYFLT